jgi:hypothetical protein
MKFKLLITTLLVAGAGGLAFGRPGTDSSATISAATEAYEFVYNTKSNSVQVKEKLSTTYTANVYQATIPVAEMFNNQVNIENVDCRVDGHTPKDFKPLYTYYGSDDIFYSDEHICYFPVNIPKIGGSAVVKFEETFTDPRYFTSIMFPESFTVKHKEVSIKIPRWMKVELKEYNFNGFNIKKSVQYIPGDDADVITYTIDNLPATVRESNSPGPTYIYPHLLVLCKSANTGGHNFTYFNTVDDLYSWCHGLVKNTVTNQDAINAKAREITAGKATDLDKIKAIYYYVQDNTRYIAFEDGIAGFKPEAADEVLRKKYGDCKGMANLTRALLVAAGYDARLCWLGTDYIAYDYQTPSLAVGNHMICALNFQGKTYFLDATESYIGFNEYAERIQGRQIMVDNGDKYILTHVPVAGIDQNHDIETGKFAINGENFTGSVSHVWKGEDKEDVLAGLNSIKKEKTETAMITFLSAGNPDYAINALKISGTETPDKDVSVNYDVSYKDGLSAFGKDYYVDLDRKKDLQSSTIKIEERKHDFWFGHKINLSLENELTLPANYKISYLPAPLNIVNPAYEFHVQYTDGHGKLLYKKTILIKTTHLASANFAQWNKDIEQLTKTYNETVVLKPISQ